MTVNLPPLTEKGSLSETQGRGWGWGLLTGSHFVRASEFFTTFKTPDCVGRVVGWYGSPVSFADTPLIKGGI
jgi:hypothetical protein